MRLVVACLLATTVLAAPAKAQQASAGPDDGEAIVVVGTRGTPRLADQSPAPVDVFGPADLEARGLDDLNRTLQFLAPSFNYPRTATGPSGANTRGATLRGLA